MTLLNELEIEKQLTKLEGWSYNENCLNKSFEFKDFDQTMIAINLIGDLAKKLNHHPNWQNAYNRLTITISTNDIGGVSELDFTFALKTEELFQSLT